MSNATMLVKAATGLVVKGPGGLRVTDAVAFKVPCDSFWRRRLRDGDVVPGEAAPASAPALIPDPLPSAAEPEPKPIAASTAPLRRRARRDDEPTGEES
jgi:hypothetical protein